MAAKPLSKTKIVSHLAEKAGTPKKTAALFFEELFKLAVKEAKGSIKETVGKVTGDGKTEAEGKVDKALGKAQNAVGGIKDKLREAHR